MQPITTFRYSKQHGPEDQNWYWAALLLLDREHFPVASQRWFKRPELAQVWSGALDASDDESNPWHEHVQQASTFAAKPWLLGRPPENLAQILTLLALDGPGITMLRALWRITTAIAPELGIKVALGVDEVQVDHEQGTVQLEGRRLRSHFALRFGDEKTEDRKGGRTSVASGPPGRPPPRYGRAGRRGGQIQGWVARLGCQTPP